LLAFGHNDHASLHGRGTDVTIQFHHILDAGSGMFVHTSYGPKHIAIHTSAVSVGTTYNLNCESKVHHGTHKKPSVGHLNGNPNIHGAGIYQPGDGQLPGIVNTGIQSPIVLVSGGRSKHPNK